MIILILLECLVVVISADNVADSGQFYRKIGSEQGAIATDSTFINADFFNCQQSHSCVEAGREAKKTERWGKVSSEQACKYLHREI